ncbi:MAG: hypothetical protein JRH16_18200 [Deltaproteobacteria bacterium]|nr:hypothetical protein [Deltaproteobacteria bacterium]MBW2421425.1 hypothetical protein [Deltaproteobacteria bacterium]
MRRLIGRVLGPAVNTVFDRLEQRVTAGDHRAVVDGWLDGESRQIAATSLVGRIAGRLAREVADNLGRPTRADAAGDRELRREARAAIAAAESWTDPLEAGETAAVLQWITLLPASTDPAETQTAPPIAPAALGPADADASRAAARLTLLAASLSSSAAPRAFAAPLRAHAEAFEPRQWFLRRGVRYGTSQLLRSLLRASGGQHLPDLAPYAREVCDRLMRHVEVRRQDCLPFEANSLPNDAEPIVERLRFAIALVEAAWAFEDLRYLNSALKLFDWSLDSVRRGAVSRAASLHYAVGIGRQERAMRELLLE